MDLASPAAKTGAVAKKLAYSSACAPGSTQPRQTFQEET
jgi:hypothetical protein